MNELMTVNYSKEIPTVSGRELHAVLEVKTEYKDWFPRMCEYGFVDGTDFRSFLSESTGGRPATDHEITVDMAKEICMLQRTEKDLTPLTPCCMILAWGENEKSDSHINGG